ncbi:hypothetical protein DFH06DRAFT_1273758 [Mycena polygramma]|nr:hypothetical protein DFH06DRAFT_1273758 [Mycena polygramma]
MYIHDELVHTEMEVSRDLRCKRLKTTHHGTAATFEDYEASVDLRTRAAMEEVEEFSYALGDDSMPLDPDEYMNSGGATVVQAEALDNSEVPLRTFLKHRSSMLDRVMTGEGRGKLRLWAACGECGSTAPTYRCRDQDCAGGQLFCKACMLLRHAALPLHWIEEWTGRNFARLQLKDIGLRMQLGHAPLRPGSKLGKKCAFRRAVHEDFVVLHTNGIHNVAVDYCGCGTVEGRDQLLDACWFPATPLEPQTCCTFTMLRQFHTLNTVGKVSGYDYYKTLELLTDNTGNVKGPDRRRPFMRCVREWRNMQLFKRAGRVHALSGVDGTADGELAQFCHACPQPGLNLPDGWNEEGASTAFKYYIHLGQDANFRARGRLVSSDAKDPTLGQGLAYFVDKIPYTEHIKHYVNQEEISSCSGFAAMFLANLKRVKGLRTSGVGGVTCTRHNMWRANGMGDLQKGERYCNMDWVFASSMRNSEILHIMFTYDINCQYFKGFWDRMRKLPEYLHLNIPPSNIFFYVPNFHLPPHKDDCHGPFSLHFAPGAGMTNGEGIEQNWENTNGAASQTKQMGPGSRQDTLDDILGAHNYRKTLALGRILLKRLLEALKQSVKHRRALDAFTEGLESAQPGITAQWAEVEEAWQADRRKPPEDACAEYLTGKTMKDVELELAKEVFEKTASDIPVVHESSRSMFVVTGIELEETQRVLEMEIKAKKAATTYQELDFQKRRNGVQRAIERFRALQEIYMPGLLDELGPGDQALLKANAKKEVETVKLFLPSALSAGARANACAPGVAKIEERLRFAEAGDSLEGLRSGLRMRTVTNCFKIENITGQRANTRAQGIQHLVNVRIHLAKLRYRWAREGYAKLAGQGGWTKRLQVLEDEDDRMRESGALNELQRGGVAAAGVVVQGEGTRTLSWIWYASGGGEMGEKAQRDAADEGKHDVSWMDWLKARARAMRWREELILLEEEMRRSIASAEYVAQRWEERATERVSSGEPMVLELAEGLAGYACEHAATAVRRAEVITAKWKEAREKGYLVLQGLDSGELVDVLVKALQEVEGEEEGERGMYEELDS